MNYIISNICHYFNTFVFTILIDTSFIQEFSCRMCRSLITLIKGCVFPNNDIDEMLHEQLSILNSISLGWLIIDLNRRIDPRLIVIYNWVTLVYLTLYNKSIYL